MRFKINVIFIISIIILGMFMISQLVRRGVVLLGEYPSHVLTAVSLERGLTGDIIKEDVDKAKQDFPEFVQGLNEQGLYKKVKGDKEIYRGYYSSTYSLAIIPIKNILKLIGISQSYAFMITNVVIFLIAVILFINAIKVKIINKIICVMILIFNPILFYMAWPSYEVFIYSMLVISLTFFIKEKYKISIIFAFLAATLNITLVFYEIIIVLSYLIKKYKNISIKSFAKKIYMLLKENWKTLLYFCVLIIWSAISFWGGILERTSANVNFEGWTSRFLAYLFDLNIGMAPYYGVIMVLLVIGGIKGFRQKNIKFYLIIAAFLLTVLAYSLKPHINSGATCISRYNSWSAALLIFAVIVYINELRISKKELFYYLIGGTSILIIVFLYGGWMTERWDYTYFMPPAKLVLDKLPTLYNVNDQIFSTRVLHSELISYKDSVGPITYVNSEGYITKVLLRKELLEELDKYITIGNERLEKIKEKNINNKKDYIFINFSEKEKIEFLTGEK